MSKYIAAYNWDKMFELSPCKNCLVFACCKFKNDKYTAKSECKKVFHYHKFIKEYLFGSQFKYHKKVKFDVVNEIREDKKLIEEYRNNI